MASITTPALEKANMAKWNSGETAGFFQNIFPLHCMTAYIIQKKFFMNIWKLNHGPKPTSLYVRMGFLDGSVSMLTTKVL